MDSNNNCNNINLIYAGGTFGCHGTPLTPLPALEFLPILLSKAKNIGTQLSIIHNDLVKDSSHLSTNDFYYFYKKIHEYYTRENNQFIIITGTDTLSYLSAYLYECFKGADISICLTASMHPLLNTNSNTLQINDDSDAWHNFMLAVDTTKNFQRGVYVCIHEDVFLANSVQKIYSMQEKAFTGKKVQCLPKAYTEYKKIGKAFNNTSNNFYITPAFIYPTTAEHLLTQLDNIITTAEKLKKIACIVIFGFGTGNIPYSVRLANFFKECFNNDHLIFITSQCSFDGVNQEYAAGSWLSENHVLSCANLTKELIFARILYLSMQYNDSNAMRDNWHNNM